MTNGTITKQILKAAKELSGETLYFHAAHLMQSFPLSSEKLLYDWDKDKVSPKNWPILLKAAVTTDKIKGEQCNRLLKEAGCKPYTSYGRWSSKKK